MRTSELDTLVSGALPRLATHGRTIWEHCCQARRGYKRIHRERAFAGRGCLASLNVDQVGEVQGRITRTNNEHYNRYYAGKKCLNLSASQGTQSNLS